MRITCSILVAALNFCSLTCTVAKVIQLSALDATLADDDDAVDLGAVYGESTFHADTGRNTSNGKGFAKTAVLACDYNAFVSLDTFLVTFDNLEVYANGVAYVESGNFAERLRFDLLDDVHDDFSSKIILLTKRSYP